MRHDVDLPIQTKHVRPSDDRAIRKRTVWNVQFVVDVLPGPHPTSCGGILLYDGVYTSPSVHNVRVDAPTRRRDHARATSIVASSLQDRPEGQPEGSRFTFPIGPESKPFRAVQSTTV